jgi:hypothetical protein
MPRNAIPRYHSLAPRRFAACSPQAQGLIGLAALQYEGRQSCRRKLELRPHTEIPRRDRIRLLRSVSGIFDCHQHSDRRDEKR